MDRETGGEGAPVVAVDPRREKGYIPGKAAEIAKAIWGAVPKRHLEIDFGCTLTTEEIAVLRERMVTIGTHLVEAARTSPMTGCKGSYEAVRRYYSNTSFIVALWKGQDWPVGLLRVHETMHGAVAVEARGDPVPGFLKAESQIGDATLLHEEIHAALLWAFGQKFARKAKDFDSALDALYRYYYPQLHGLMKSEARRKGKNIDAAMQEFEALWKQVRENPEPVFLARARRIFDGEKSGNKKISMQEFLAMTQNVKALS